MNVLSFRVTLAWSKEESVEKFKCLRIRDFLQHLEMPVLDPLSTLGIQERILY